MTAPSAEDFRALARSSPWRWSTLRFTARWAGPWAPSEPVRAWLRRPDRLRVETLDGGLVEVVRHGSGGVTSPLLSTDGPVTAPFAEPEPPGPRFRSDGLVAERPSILEFCADDPMYVNYSWVALLDPLELADGCDDRGRPAGPGAEVGDVVEVEHGGRPAWEALLRPGETYEPRCGCCSLLRSPRIDRLEWGEPRLVVYPEATRVRLDVGTGVCVLTEAVGGSESGAGHDVRIEAVDEPMADDLFAPPPRRLFGVSGWAPLPQ